VLQRQKPTLATWQYQTRDPWFRVNRWHTLSSYRREVCRDEPTAPRDSLDIVLNAEYNHFREWLKSKAEVLLQRDTLDKPHESVTKRSRRAFTPQRSAAQGAHAPRQLLNLTFIVHRVTVT